MTPAVKQEIINLLTECLKSSTPSARRFFALMSPHCPTLYLAKNFRSLDWRERYAIAQNPKTPDIKLKALAKDGNRIVRGAAQANLASRQADPSQS